MPATVALPLSIGTADFLVNMGTCCRSGGLCTVVSCSPDVPLRPCWTARPAGLPGAPAGDLAAAAPLRLLPLLP